MKSLIKYISFSILFVLLLSFSGCKKSDIGYIKIDGSSTVGPITEAVAEEFNLKHRDIKITMGISGTGGGFKKFAAGETDINDASRKVKDIEKKEAEKNNVNMTEFEVAQDGIAVVVNKDNNWVDNLSSEDLKKIWNKDSKVKYWSDLKDGWPHEEIRLYGPGTDSGTFEYFTEAINGKARNIRPDFTASTDPNVLVLGAAGDKFSLGYMGAAYYEENKDKLKVLKVNGVLPTMENVIGGKYKPLSRPLYLYVNEDSLKRPEVNEFLKFYMENAKSLSKEVGYFPLKDDIYEENLKRLR